MRRISLFCSIALVAFVVGSAAAEVTREELAAQAAAVAEAQAALDSLFSLANAQALAALADSNEALAAASVQVLIATPSSVSGLRDPDYVDVDIPYSTWDAATRRLWVLTLREDGIAAINAGLGRYTLHRGNVPAFLTLVELFLDSAEDEEE